jgi:hypothetical protein
MKKSYLLAWELGSGLGHAAPQALIARELLRLGHEVHLVWKDLTPTQWVIPDLLTHPGLKLWQAPLWQRPLRGVPEAANYAELLFHAGWLDALGLAPLVHAWRALLQTISPDVLLVDHAPTALLASRGLGLTTAQMGTGFFKPPTLSAQTHDNTPCMPNFRPWETLDPKRLMNSEKLALKSANQLLSTLTPEPIPLKNLADLLVVDQVFLFTTPALDHYGAVRSQQPKPAHYWGALPTLETGDTPHWPLDSSTGSAPQLPKVFAYLKADLPCLAQVLSVLRSGPWQALVYVLGLDPAIQAKYSHPQMHLVGKPLHIKQVLAQAQAVVCPAGHGLLAEALGAGVPVVMLPMFVEQRLLALRVEEAGCGVLVAPPQLPTHFAPALHKVLHDTALRAEVQRYSKTCATASVDVVAQALVNLTLQR